MSTTTTHPKIVALTDKLTGNADHFDRYYTIVEHYKVKRPDDCKDLVPKQILSDVILKDFLRCLEFDLEKEDQDWDNLRDRGSEWAGYEVDVIYHNMYLNLHLFAEETDEVLKYMHYKDLGDLLQAGQRQAYESFAYLVLDLLEKIYKPEENKTEQV